VFVTARKSPRQARSRATVEAIIEATAQVLVREGYERFTTTRAAERAGVSIGSLYQYFPNKTSLTCAVIERCCGDFLRAFQSAVAGKATLSECITALVEFALVSERIPRELHWTVNELTVTLGLSQQTQIVREAVTQALEALLRTHADEIAPEIDLPAAARLIQTTLEALAHRAIDPAQSQAARDERLIAETVRMLERYLVRH
jgi:AcrR family transcriptional regulator